MTTPTPQRRTLRITSDGTSQNSRVSVVNDDGTETDISAFVTSVGWRLDAPGRAECIVSLVPDRVDLTGTLGGLDRDLCDAEITDAVRRHEGRQR